MRKTALIFLAAATLCACHHDSLADKAEKIANDYTERYCPTPAQDMTITDSITFDRNTLTFNYYYTLTDKADDAKAIGKVRDKIGKTLVSKLREDTGMRAFKDAAYNFHYVYRSQKTGDILFEKKITKKEYK